jgi:hypothetical protein
MTTMKRVAIGAALFITAYAVYRIKTLPKQIVNVNGVPTSQQLGSAIDLGDPYLYAAAVAGALAGKVLG